MSYCLWSSDRFMCDVYAYKHSAGYYIIKLASNAPEFPSPDDFSDDAAYLRWKRTVPVKPIPHPWAGKTFHASDLHKFRDLMAQIRSAGFNFPDDVFDTIAAEIANLEHVE